MLPFSAVTTEAAMKVEIIERKPTTIVTFSIPNVQFGAAIAMAAVAEFRLRIECIDYRRG